jgi:2-polyprenyl-3-methyl-5-hydroxy-6-metoxy-1,4-benzoquinol methylase
VLDVATGAGDVPISLARRARRSGLEIGIDGCDISPVAIRFAARAADAAGVPVGFFPLAARNEPLPGGYDIVMCSLFLHHLGEDDAVGLLRDMAGAARSTILVNDLLRTWAGYGLAWTGCRLLSRSPIVHHDGPASVRAAFRLDEVRVLAERAGLAGVELRRRWPCRFLLSWSRGR